MNQEEQKILEIQTRLAMSILMQNTTNQFSGKLEIWFKDGLAINIKNTQTFGGVSLTDYSVHIYKPSDKDGTGGDIDPVQETGVQLDT